VTKNIESKISNFFLTKRIPKGIIIVQVSKGTVHLWEADVVCIHFMCIGESTDDGANYLSLESRGRFMGRVRRTLRKQSFRKIIIYFLTWCLALNTSLPAVMATPAGGVFKVGSGTIVQNVVGGDNTVLVNQAESVIEWGGIIEGGCGGIDTGSSESLSFSQIKGLSNSAVLNRIVSGNLTQFNGALNGEGMRIFIVNPAGIVFGEGSTVNVTQLVASGLSMSNDAFHDVLDDVSNKMVFADGSGNVTNNGTINAADSAYLVGKNVTNGGSILCPNGLVVMAAGDEVQLGQPGSSVIVTLADLGDADGTNVVDNSGTVGTADKPIDKLVLAAGDVWSQAISNVKKVKIASVEDPDLNNISAYTEAASDSVAEVDIEVGGDLIVDSCQIGAEAVGNGVDNATATTTINTGGDVIVTGKKGTGRVYALAHNGSTNKADVEINAGGNVDVIAGKRGNSSLYANAAYGVQNLAGVDITAGQDVRVMSSNDHSLANIGARAANESDVLKEIFPDAKDNIAAVKIDAGGGVEVLAEYGSEAQIGAFAEFATTNTAEIAIEAVGPVELQAEDGTAKIESWAQNGFMNIAETIVCTGGGVQVVDKSQLFRSAGITANALNGYHADAYVGICAQDDVIVAAGIAPEEFGQEMYGTGGHAMIMAEASSNSDGYEAEEAPTSNAEVAVISHNGGVAVIDAANTQVQEPGTAQITSSAFGGEINTAYTGVSAGGDLLNEEHPFYEKIQGTGVLVQGIGYYSDAKIISEINNYDSYYDGYVINISDTVVCTPSEVVVKAEGGFSVTEIGSCAIGGIINAATTQVYAADVYVHIPYGYGAGGIKAHANGLEFPPSVPYLGDSGNYDPMDGDNLQFILTEYDGDYGYHDLVWIAGEIEADDDIATLLIGDYSKRQDCPECPFGPGGGPVAPEPAPEPMRLFVPAAPLPERLSFEISGYPALMNWVAKELGVDTGSIQIGVTGSLASTKDIQPYRSFSKLRAVATILQDAGGQYINALAQVIYEFASSTAPPTEEQMASIADAMVSNTGANNQYALAAKYLDALAEYVGILNGEMGFTKEQAVQLATEKYVNKLAESDNPAVAAYIAARLAAMGG